MTTETPTEYLKRIGSAGGKKSRRKLSKKLAREMALKSHAKRRENREKKVSTK